MAGLISWLNSLGRPVPVSAANPLPVSGAGSGGAMEVEGVVARLTAADPNPVVVGGRNSGGLVQTLQVDANGFHYPTGNTGAGGVDTGNPIKVGAKYSAARPTYADGQRTDAQADTRGNLGVAIFGANATTGADVISASTDTVSPQNGLVVQSFGRVLNGAGTWDRQRGSAGEGTIVKPFAFGAATLRTRLAALGAGSNTLFVAAGAAVRNMLTSFTLSQPAGAVANTVQIFDGAGNLWQLEVPAGAGIWTFEFPLPLRGSLNTAMTLTTSSAGPVTVNAIGYTVTE